MAHDLALSIVELSKEMEEHDKERRTNNFITECYKNCYVLRIDAPMKLGGKTNVGCLVIYLVDDEIFIKSRANCVCHIDITPDRLINLRKHHDTILTQVGCWFSLIDTNDDYTYELTLGKVSFQKRKDNRKVVKDIDTFHKAYYTRHTNITTMILNAIVVLKTVEMVV